MTRSNAAIDREVKDALIEDGPLTHDELCDRVGLEWDELQQSIRRLRSDGDVVNTIDRQYSATESASA